MSESDSRFPSLLELACRNFALKCFLFEDRNRLLLYDSEEVWQAVLRELKKFNRIDSRCFAALLNLPYETNMPSKGAKSSQESNGKANLASNSSSKAKNPKKSAAQLSKNAFALLDDYYSESSGKTLENDPETSPKEAQASEQERTISKYGSSITDLNISYCYQITDRTSIAMANAKMPLKHLCLSGCFQISDSFLEHLIEPCLLSLETFSVGLTSKKEKQRFAHHIEWSIIRGEELKTLPPLPNISADCIFKVVSSCHQISKLNISGAKLTKESFEDMFSYSALMERATDVDLSFCLSDYDPPQSLNTDISDFAPNLRHFSCNYTNLINTKPYEANDPDDIATQLEATLCKLEGLESLEIRGPEIPEESLPVFSRLTNLSSLVASDVFHLHHLSGNMSKLTRLELSNYQAPAQIPRDTRFWLEPAQNLRVFKATRLNYSPNPASEIALMLQTHPKLEKVILSDGTFLTTEDQRRHSTILKSLEIGARGVTTPIMANLVSSYPRLERLTFFSQSVPVLELRFLHQLPFLTVLDIDCGGFLFDSPEDIGVLSGLKRLEVLKAAMTPNGFRSLLSVRFSWALALRHLGVVIQDSTSWPDIIPMATKNIPRWSTLDKVNNDAALFPSLSVLEINKVDTWAENVWKILAIHICPNLKSIVLTGWRNEAATPSDEFDNVGPEESVENIVYKLLELLPRLSNVTLVNCWKEVWVHAGSNTKEQPPSAYFEKKLRFLQKLKSKNINVIVDYDYWTMIRPYGDFRMEKSVK